MKIVNSDHLLCLNRRLIFHDVCEFDCWGNVVNNVRDFTQSGYFLLAAHFQFKLLLFVQVYFPVVRLSVSTKQLHVPGDWVTSPAFKRILFCEAKEMDHGANLFWHCHAGGAAIHSAKANRGGKGDHFAYSALIVKTLHSFRCRSSAVIAPKLSVFRSLSSHLLCWLLRIT